jgi:5-hydroxyisourate hydrolase
MSPGKSTLSTHVLDTAAGLPAEGIAVRLETRAGDHLDQDTTDADGRIGSLGGELGPGDYVLRFDTGTRYERGFFPEVVIVFTIADDRHHHVPVLLSPYGYSTYRGS